MTTTGTTPLTSKKDISDLASFGGEPAFAEVVRVGRPNLGDRGRFLERLNHALDTRSLTNDGPYVRELERNISSLTGAKHCIAVCNATVGLEIAIRASGLSGEVIIPSFTFVATAHALQWQRIHPVFADVDLATHTLDPGSVERQITSRTTGILGVHLWGRACDIDGLTAVAERHRLSLLFDAAHAFGSSYRKQMIGNFGRAEVFSFHATKFINSFEGGAIATNDDDLASKARLMRNFGFANPDETLYEGTNGKMSEVSAAMGLTSLESLDDIVAINRDNHRSYSEGLGEIDGLRVVPFADEERHNYQYVVTEIEERPDRLTRDQLLQVLLAENVMTRRYFYPGCHRLQPYGASTEVDPNLPNTEQLSRTVLCFPTGTAVDAEAVGRISEIVRLAITRGTEIKERLQQVVV
jgi:dTDP-4-amino-4,6-dideoxygalactose transaminase